MIRVTLNLETFKLKETAQGSSTILNFKLLKMKFDDDVRKWSSEAVETGILLELLAGMMQSLDSKLRFATPESRRPNTLFCSPRLMMIIGCSDSQTLAGLTAQPRTIPRQQAEASVWNDSNGIVQIPSFSSNF